MTFDLLSANDVQADESMNSQNGKCSARGRPLSQRPSIAFLVAVAVAVAGCTSEKDRLDAEAKRLCAIDGGIKVFETVTLPPEAFYENGLPKLVNNKEAELRWGYQKIFVQVNLTSTNDEPKLTRDEYKFIRTSDRKIIATSVIYRRLGGSWWGGLIHGDAYSCPSDDVNIDFDRKTFIQGVEK